MNNQNELSMENLKAKREEYAMKHFNKHENELNLDQLKELDIEHPGWQIEFTQYSDPVEVTLGGTRARNPKDKNEYYIFYTYRNGKPLYPFIYIKSQSSNRRYPQSIHQMVAKANVANPDPEHKTEVNHIDGNKWNNDYLNLEWVTHAENAQHAINTGLHEVRVGEDSSYHKYTNDQIKRVCELLKYRPDLSYDKITELTGVDRGIIGTIYLGKRWQHISKDYVPFPPRDAVRRGEDAGNVKYTADQITLVCELLQNRPDMKYDEIEEITGVDRGVIGQVYVGDTWVSISKDYTFPPRDSYPKGENSVNAKFTRDQIEEACRLLDENATGKANWQKKQIAEMSGVSVAVVKHLFRGKCWTDVAKNHVFYQMKFPDKVGRR